jgi:hypothetical protein
VRPVTNTNVSEDSIVKKGIRRTVATGIFGLALAAATGTAGAEPLGARYRLPPNADSNANCVANASASYTGNGQAPTLGQGGDPSHGNRGDEIKGLQASC